MVTMRLDRDGYAPVPDGYVLVTTEVDFLRLATESRPLHIRGARLCSWAEAFFTARKIPFVETQSYLQEIKDLLPELSSSEISKIIDLLGPELDTLERPLTVKALINAAAPHSLWNAPLSHDPIKHLAQWYLWLCEADSLEVLSPLLHPIITRWQLEDLPFDPGLYSITTEEAARTAIHAWLGITDRDQFPIRQEFPLQVPQEFLQSARDIWRGEIIESRGARFEQLDRRDIPFELRMIAAEEAYQYYLRKPEDLTQERLRLLVQYLSPKQMSALRAKLPPAQPSEMPDTPGEVVKWYLQEYLPYREWQRTSDSEQAQAVVLKAARQFALWYLDQYPRGINGGSLYPWINFNRINQAQNDHFLTFIIILDGMHVSDSRMLLQNILSETRRLSVVQEYAFAPIPTVTEFAKDALLKGMPPAHAQNFEPIGEIISERISPASRLEDAEVGSIYFWRVQEPDKTYHHNNSSENLLIDVEGRLRAEAMKIKEIVNNLPASVMLQIILTTDHGRMLSETHKTIPVPPNMESRGRVAWGQSPYPLNGADYRIEDEVAYLSAESYGMSFDMAIPLDEGAFRDNRNRSGTELFPHGGIFPEEVIVPWYILARDAVQPEAKFSIDGKGNARREGTFHVKVVNESDVDFVLERITITLITGQSIVLKPDRDVRAMSAEQLEISYSPWPSPDEAKVAQAIAQVRLPNRLVYEYSNVEASLTSQDFYIRPKDNILEDLD